MATRFYLPSSGAAPVSPAYDAAWEQTGEADRVALGFLDNDGTTALTDKTVTVPITTSQQILSRQFVSTPLHAINISGTVSCVLRGLESALTANAFPAIGVRVVSNDGATVRGTLLTVQSTGGVEYVTTAATRLLGNRLSTLEVTPVTSVQGDRLVIEIGVDAQAPEAATTATQRFGNNAASDFAFTSALTTDLNPWVEFSMDLFGSPLNNYSFVSVGDGMSTGEKIR